MTDISPRKPCSNRSATKRVPLIGTNATADIHQGVQKTLCNSDDVYMATTEITPASTENLLSAGAIHTWYEDNGERPPHRTGPFQASPAPPVPAHRCPCKSPPVVSSRRPSPARHERTSRCRSPCRPDRRRQLTLIGTSASTDQDVGDNDFKIGICDSGRRLSRAVIDHEFCEDR